MAKILVVDDEPDLIILVDRVLRKEGHEVIGASGGEEALEKLRGLRPDLILLDIMMPRLDGWQTLRLIRKLDGFKDVPVAMLTAKALTPEVIAREEIGELVDYIQKPFTKRSLIEKVNEILESLREIREKKKKLDSVVDDPETIDTYEFLARTERLHQSMLRTLNRVFEETSEEEPERAEELKEVLAAQREAVERLRKGRLEIEKRLSHDRR
ncbi:MAG: response regulator [Methanobacteriota archaeon]|nr:MAG: response regulator [Euryarchaeota archaeon]